MTLQKLQKLCQNEPAHLLNAKSLEKRFCESKSFCHGDISIAHLGSEENRVIIGPFLTDNAPESHILLLLFYFTK